MSSPLSTSKGDLLILANIYVGILSEKQNRMLFDIVSSPGRMGHIKGTYPMGMFFVINYSIIFEPFEIVLKHMKDDNEDLLPYIIVKAAKHIMKIRV